MSHPLVIGLFDSEAAAARAAAALHRLGVDREHLSVVAGSPADEDDLTRALDASPGAEIAESVLASRLGELGALVVAAVAVVLPGVGPIVAAGPLGAEFSSLAGHAAGDLGAVLAQAGFPPERASRWERAVSEGRILLGAHVIGSTADPVREAMKEAGASEIAQVTWAAGPE